MWPTRPHNDPHGTWRTAPYDDMWNGTCATSYDDTWHTLGWYCAADARCSQCSGTEPRMITYLRTAPFAAVDEAKSSPTVRADTR
jgi:hypothetical protein